MCSAVQSQKAVSAYFTNKQILPFPLQLLLFAFVGLLSLCLSCVAIDGLSDNNWSLVFFSVRIWRRLTYVSWRPRQLVYWPPQTTWQRWSETLRASRGSLSYCHHPPPPPVMRRRKCRCDSHTLSSRPCTRRASWASTRCGRDEWKSEIWPDLRSIWPRRGSCALSSTKMCHTTFSWWMISPPASTAAWRRWTPRGTRGTTWWTRTGRRRGTASGRCSIPQRPAPR